MDWSELSAILSYSTIRRQNAQCDFGQFSQLSFLFDPGLLPEAGTVCFATASLFERVEQPTGRGLAFVLFLDKPLAGQVTDLPLITLSNEDEFRQCYQQLASEFSALRQMRERILVLATLVSTGSGLQRLINEVADIFGRPASIIDTSLAMRAVSDDFPELPPDSETRLSGFLLEDIQQLLRQAGLVNPHNKTDTVTVFSGTDFSGRVYTNHFAFISIGKTPIGSLSIFSGIEPMRKSRIDLMPDITRLLSIEMQKDSTVLLNKSSFYTHLLTSLFDGETQMSVEFFQTRFALFGYVLKQYKYLFYIDFSQEFFDVSRTQSFAELFHQAMPNNIYIVRNGNITLLSSSASGFDLPAMSDTLQEIVEGTHIRIGISDIFENILTARTYLLQAQHAITTGLIMAPGDSVFSFDRYRMADLLTKVDDRHILYSYRYPPLMKVIDEDKRHRTNLAWTLYLYLKNPAEPAEVCKELFIHKNTLYYRLDKIRSLMGTDLKQAEVIMQIQFTFLLLRFQGRFESLVLGTVGRSERHTPTALSQVDSPSQRSC